MSVEEAHSTLHTGGQLVEVVRRPFTHDERDGFQREKVHLVFQLLHAAKLFAAGHFVDAFQYAEAVGREFLASPLSRNSGLLTSLLKLCAAILAKMQGGRADMREEKADPLWLIRLRRHLSVLAIDGPNSRAQQSPEPSHQQEDTLGTVHTDGGGDSSTAGETDSAPAPLQGQNEEERPRQKKSHKRRFWTTCFCCVSKIE